jgi:hypothetical protein
MRGQGRHFQLGIIGAISVACVLATAPVSNAVQVTAPVVTTTGTYQGLMNFQKQAGDRTSGVNVFFGIRYGQALEGMLRWRPPQAPNPGQGSIVAGTFGNTCPQGRATDSEDCLFLNVKMNRSHKTPRPDGRMLDDAERFDAALRATGRLVGPPHGIPVVVKDDIDVAGMVMTSGFQSCKNSYAAE